MKGSGGAHHLTFPNSFDDNQIKTPNNLHIFLPTSNFPPQSARFYFLGLNSIYPRGTAIWDAFVVQCLDGQLALT